MRLQLVLGLLALALTAPSAWATKPTLDYTTSTKNGNTTDAQTDTTLWDPAANYRVVLQGCVASADATQTLEIEVSDVDVLPPIYLAANTSITIAGGFAPIYVGAVDGVLAYTTTTSANTTITCWGWEDIF